jgi:NAD(P)-dependent dehydrogenase (short-subunit alcohol dehydrogenase family)
MALGCPRALQRIGAAGPAWYIVTGNGDGTMSIGSLSKKTCLVTGASRGLGAALVRRFWSEGASLVLAVRTPASVAALVTELESRASDAQTLVVVALDLLDPDSVRSLVSRTRARGVERIDVLVNSAAVLGPIGGAAENPPDEWASAVTADLISPALICGAIVPWMAGFGGGRIINLSGGGATGPRPGFSAYAAAKAGLVRFSETLAEEVRALGITVNCVAPGVMATNMLAVVEQAGADVAGSKEYAAAKKALEGGDKSLEPGVELITFLASPRSDGITGKLISAVWDNWRDFPNHLGELASSDVLTLRRLAGRDRGLPWTDKYDE